MHAKSFQSCPMLCEPMDCSPLGSSVHVILQARILDWVAIFFSRGSSWPRDQTWVSCIAGGCFTVWATREGYEITQPIKTNHAIFQDFLSHFLRWSTLCLWCVFLYKYIHFLPIISTLNFATLNLLATLNDQTVEKKMEKGIWVLKR